jgi:hypothetical protein
VRFPGCEIVRAQGASRAPALGLKKNRRALKVRNNVMLSEGLASSGFLPDKKKQTEMVCFKKKLHARVESGKSLVSKKLRIKAEFQLAALGSKFRFPAHLLRRRFESAQTANLLHDPFGIELVFEPFEGSVDRLTFSHNNFGHKKFYSSRRFFAMGGK